MALFRARERAPEAGCRARDQGVAAAAHVHAHAHTLRGRMPSPCSTTTVTVENATRAHLDAQEWRAVARKQRLLKRLAVIARSRGERRSFRRAWRTWRLMKAVHERIETYGVWKLQAPRASVLAQLALQLWRNAPNGSALLRVWLEWTKLHRNRGLWRKVQFVYTREISRQRMRAVFAAWAGLRKSVRARALRSADALQRGVRAP